MHRFDIYKIWIAWLFVFSLYIEENLTIKVENLSENRSNNNVNENWHSDTIRPMIYEEPKVASTSDFYLNEILKQLVAINKKIDRAMIRVIGSTVRGDDNDENIIKARYPNYTEPNCESLINSDSPSGIYHFPNKSPWVWNIFQIYCDQSFGGGWTVIQRKIDHRLSTNPVNFTSKSWDDYAKGFGDLNGDFWLGNEWIHRLTTLLGPYELRIEFEDPLGQRFTAQYSEFTLDSRKNNYRLKIDGFTIKNSTDISSTSNSTNLEQSSPKNGLLKLENACTMDFHGTWWYPDNCFGVNLNSDYYKNTKMMIRLKNNQTINVTNDTGTE